MSVGAASGALSPEEEQKAQAELAKIAESSDEDQELVEKIEGAQKVLLEEEKKDNEQLKRTVTNLKVAVRRATLKPGSGDQFAIAAAAAKNMESGDLN